MAERIAVIGTGYVGLVAAVGLADFGNSVVGVDVDPEKVAKLQGGVSPIYEQAMEEYLERNLRNGRLSFSTDVEAAVRSSRLLFIAAGTPEGPGGDPDLSQVEAVARLIGRCCVDYKVVVIKSTVPVGTNRRIARLLRDLAAPVEVDVVSNPEFLREGRAVYDFFNPERVVIGGESPRATAILRSVYRSRHLDETPFLFCSWETAELIKYASNGFLATKITFMNQMAQLAECVGADVATLAKGLGMDSRIGPLFLQAGPGYGGSCFPKDTIALVRTGERCGADMTLIREVIRANEAHKARMAEKVERLVGPLEGRTVALLGLAFKAGTDDVRESPALVIAEELLRRGARVRVHDPKALENARKILGDRVAYCASEFEALTGAHAVVLATEWNEYRNLDLERARGLMAALALVDLRNLVEPEEARARGFAYDGVGYPGS